MSVTKPIKAAIANNGKPWHYLLIPHDQIASNLSLDYLKTEFV